MLGKVINQFIFQFGNYVLPFLIIPFLINKISLDIYKDFVIIQTLVIFFAVLVSYGLDLFGVRHISKISNSQKKCKDFIVVSLVARVIIFLLVSVFLFISLYALTDSNTLYWFLCIFWLSSFIFQLNWYFQGIGEFKNITLYGLVPKLLLYPFVFVFVKNDHDAWIYLFLCGLANYTSNIAMLWHVYRSLESTPLSLSKLKSKVLIFFRRGWYIFFSQASVALISYANIFILPLILDTKSFVVFSTAERIVKVLSISTTPVLNVLFPYISLLLNKDKAKAFSIISKISLIGVALFTFFYMLYIFFGAIFVELVFPKISIELQIVLVFLLINVLFVFMNNLYGTQIGLNCGKDMIFSKIIAYNGFLNLILMAVLGYFFGLNGVIFSSLTIQVSMLICMYILAKKCDYKFKV